MELELIVRSAVPWSRREETIYKFLGRRGEGVRRERERGRAEGRGGEDSKEIKFTFQW